MSLELTQSFGDFKTGRLEEKAVWYDKEHIVVSGEVLGLTKASMPREVLSAAEEFDLYGLSEREVPSGIILLQEVAQKQSAGFHAYVALENPHKDYIPLIFFDGEESHLFRPDRCRDSYRFSAESLWLFRRGKPNC